MATTSADWREAERDLPRPVPELARLARRARRRWGIALVAALAIAATAAGASALRSRTHEAQLVLRVSEGIIADGAGMPRGELRGYVESALLTRDVLLDIIESEELFPGKLEQSAGLAIDAFERALELEVYGNFFATWRRVGPRSLRVRISYRSQDRREAVAVVRAIARIIESAEIEQRQWRFDKSADLSKDVIVRAEDRLADSQRDFAAHLLSLGRAESAGDPIHAGSLRLQARQVSDSMSREQRALRDAWVGRWELVFRRDATRARLGILFEVVDEVIPPPPPADPWVPLTAIGVIAFALALPLSGIAAGAFDGRLHERGDVDRLGLPALGHVPRFRGHELGALQTRRRAKRRFRALNRPRW